MKPGRELDALIAEKVMGYTKQLVPAHSLPNTDIPGATFPRQDSFLFVNSGGYPDYFAGHCNDMFVDSSRGFKQTLRDIPEYSSDIKAAWEVAQKIKDMDEDHKFIIHLSDSEHEECEVEIRYLDNSDPKDPVYVDKFILGK